MDTSQRVLESVPMFYYITSRSGRRRTGCCRLRGTRSPVHAISFCSLSLRSSGSPVTCGNESAPHSQSVLWGAFLWQRCGSFPRTDRQHCPKTMAIIVATDHLARQVWGSSRSESRSRGPICQPGSVRETHQIPQAVDLVQHFVSLQARCQASPASSLLSVISFSIR